MYSNWIYQHLWGKICRIEKKSNNDITIFYIWSRLTGAWWFKKKSLIATTFSILYALLLKNLIQSHIPNNYKVTNKNKMSCNTLCPCISSVWEQYSKILHNMHFDHVIWHHNGFCNMFAWQMSLCVCCDICRLLWTW
jgi:hypothetical protein